MVWWLRAGSLQSLRILHEDKNAVCNTTEQHKVMSLGRLCFCSGMLVYMILHSYIAFVTNSTSTTYQALDRNSPEFQTLSGALLSVSSGMDSTRDPCQQRCKRSVGAWSAQSTCGACGVGPFVALRLLTAWTRSGAYLWDGLLSELRCQCCKRLSQAAESIYDSIRFARGFGLFPGLLHHELRALCVVRPGFPFLIFLPLY